MKPRIYFSCEDSRWLKPVSNDILTEIEKYFEEHPDYKRKFDTAEIKLPLTITNCWIDLPEEKEDEFRATLDFKYPVAKEFDKVYEYLQYRLVWANVKKDIEIIEECLGHLRGMRDTWKEVMKTSKMAPAINS